MGFWTSFYSQIFRGPRTTAFKSRRKSRRAERYGKIARHMVFVEFPRLLDEEHRVTEFLKKFVKFVHYVKKSGESAFDILFNELTQDITEEDEIRTILDELGKNISKMGRKAKNVVKYYLAQACKRIQKEEHDERAEYREVAAIINQAKKFREDKEAFMNVLRTWLKTKASLHKVLEGVVWRREISLSKRGIITTKSLKKNINSTLAKISTHFNTNKNEPLTLELEKELKELSYLIARTFNESYLVKERAILFVLRIMYIAETADENVKLKVNEHLAPKIPVEEIEDKLGQAIEHLGQEFHDVVEQGFRISIKRLERDEKEMREIERLAEV